MKLQTCTLCGFSGTGFDNHHLARRTKGNMTLTVKLCRKCHTAVEQSPAWAKANGFFDTHAQFKAERDFHTKQPTE